MIDFSSTPIREVAATAPSLQSSCQWTLAAGKALRLRAKHRSVLRIGQGRIWATFDGPHFGAPNDQGDLVLDPGDSLEMRPGRDVVLQPWGSSQDAAVQFKLDTLPDADPPCQPDLPLAPTRWQASVLEPARQFAHFASRSILALGAMLWGLASYAEFLVTGRGRVLATLESNPP